ncbi:MAG: translation initiation factor IF-3 [Candidatus Eisenbacteria bacterium]
MRINDRIRSPMVRVVGPDGTQMGVMAISDALRTARELNQDLVEVAPNSRPPVCRIMDYGKYRYEQSKREAKAKKRQHQTVVKEIKLRPKIERHDFEFKMRHAHKFLEERDKVKVTMLFRGRELSHSEIGYEILQDVVDYLQDVATVEQKPSMEGRALTMLLAPRPSAVKAKGSDDDAA